MVSSRGNPALKGVMRSTVKLTYESDRHVTASKEPQHKTIGIDCPCTGEGNEFGAVDARRIEAAVDLWPIKSNIDKKIFLSMTYNYRVARAA